MDKLKEQSRNLDIDVITSGDVNTADDINTTENKGRPKTAVNKKRKLDSPAMNTRAKVSTTPDSLAMGTRSKRKLDI